MLAAEAGTMGASEVAVRVPGDRSGISAPSSSGDSTSTLIGSVPSPTEPVTFRLLDGRSTGFVLELVILLLEDEATAFEVGLKKLEIEGLQSLIVSQGSSCIAVDFAAY